MFKQVCVIGLGKMGCSLALYYAKEGTKVIGVDINETIVENLNKGISHLTLPDSEEVLKEVLKKGLFRATTDFEEAISNSDAIIGIVPLVVDENHNINYSIVDNVAEKIGKYMKKETLISFETTLPVGTTKTRIKKIILENSGFNENDFYLGFSPERVSTNTVFEDLENIPKVIGGINEESSKKMLELYSQLLPKTKIIDLKNSDAAEFTKLMGMIYRDVNIALANEFAKFSERSKIDVLKIIEACNTNPVAHVLKPGIGAGGHCLPVYPHFFIKNAKSLGLEPKIAEDAREINDSMPEYSIEKLNSYLNLKNKNVLVLGLGYREDIKETFLSPTIEVIKHLKKKGANVYIDDPLFSKDELKKYAIPYNIFEEDKEFDAVILSTYHSKYKDIKFEDLNIKVILDGRNKLDREKIENNGIKYFGIGK